MKWIFWGASALIAYTYVGYPAWLWINSRLHPRRVARDRCTPFVSIVLAVRNEGAVIARKLQNLLQLNYPADLREIIVVSDGSTDGTNAILFEYAEKCPFLRVLAGDSSRGKAQALNDAVEHARGEVIVFVDARQEIEAEALHLLLENFADSEVGCASGELMLGDPAVGENSRGTGVYWKIEKKIRELESSCGSVVGATGAFYAARKRLVFPLPSGTILDDVYIPMQVVRHGSRVVFDARARAWDSPDLGRSREFARKVRTLSGVYQLLQLAPWLLSSANPRRLEFISHKVLRLFVPCALAAALIASSLLSQPLYRLLFAAQLGFYGLGLAGFLWPRGRGMVGRMADAAFTFVALNTAAALALVNFVTHRNPVWDRAS